MTSRGRVARVGWVVVGAGIAGMLLACSGLRSNAPFGAPVVIGFPVSLTGRFAPIGQGALNAARLFEQWVNSTGGLRLTPDGGGRPVQILSADDQSNTTVATQLFERMVTVDRADFMFAGYSSGTTLAQAPLAEQHGALTFAWGASADEIWGGGNHFVVGVITPASQYNLALLDALTTVDPRPQRLALLYQDDSFARAVVQGTVAAAPARGMQIVYQAQYPTTPTDLTPFLQAAQAANPDALFVEGHLADAELTAQNAAALPFNAPLMSYGSAAATATWISDLGAAANHTVATSQWEPNLALSPALFDDPRWQGPRFTPQQWRDWYFAAYDTEPDFRAMAAFAGGLALRAAIERAGSFGPTAVRQALVNLDMLSSWGEFDIDATLRQTGHGMVAIQWQNGAKQIIAPPGEATAPIVFPRP
ncbi:MAG: amino acid ABC transporter substrate-binding protein [Armatimonadetes bacterium]|nr:amino acid ABC transporter substrate-binding protein [Armatimonadota bacterium]